jgi:hypothetical protein
MTRFMIEREFAADPVSAALLLTGTPALEMWPGLEITGRSGPAVLAEVRHAGEQTPVEVVVLPPRRTTAAFITEFRIRGGLFADTRGSLSLGYAAGGTRATLWLDTPATEMAVPGRRFLARLARTAEGRSTAA